MVCVPGNECTKWFTLKHDCAYRQQIGRNVAIVLVRAVGSPKRSDSPVLADPEFGPRCQNDEQSRK